MPYNMSEPQYWFDRAEQARASAHAMKNPANKSKMLRIAEDFEDLGHRAHQLPEIAREPSRKKRLKRVGQKFV